MEMQNEEARLLNWLNKLDERDAEKLEQILYGDLLTNTLKALAAAPLKRIEDLLEVFENQGLTQLMAEVTAQELVDLGYEELAAKEQLKLDERMKRYALRTDNRTTYVREPVFTYYPYEGSFRWKFSRELRSSGLLAKVVEDQHGLQNQPVAFNVIADVDFKEKEVGEVNYGRWQQAMDHMNDLGIAVSGERLAFNMGGPGWRLLDKLFPLAIDKAAYGHSLNAPLLPKGFITSARVTFRVLKNLKGQDLQTDGSGWYNPTCPEMESFVAKYGVVPCQFRLVHTSGLFAKGTIFPCELADGIDLDWSQVKGSLKDLAKQRRADDQVKVVEDCYLGILQAWDRPRKISSSFELLENVQVNPRTCEIVRSQVAKAMARLFAKGIDGLVGQVAKKDPSVKLMCQLVDSLKESGQNVEYTDVPRINEAVKDALARILYKIQQGGGMKVPSLVARMDSGVPKGRCIVAGMNPGIDVACYRFPMILSQGLMVLKTMKPLAHHLVDGHLPNYQIIMNPQDLCLGMQGDDDGDFLGVTKDPEIVELFRNKLDSMLFQIEPKGKPLLDSLGQPLTTKVKEGLKYLQTDHRGPVGRTTIWRSRLLAIKAYQPATAMSVGIQENIDRAKRLPEWSDIEAAARLDNWEKDIDGVYHFTKRWPSSVLNGGEFPMERMKQWVDEQLLDAGCCARDYKGELKAKDPLWWRFEGGRVEVDNWNIPEPTRFENLVHVAARAAHAEWLSHGGTLRSKPPSQDMKWLLRMALAAKGIAVEVQDLDEREYLQLRNDSGLANYSVKLWRIQSERRSEEKEDHRIGVISALQRELTNDLVSLWKNTQDLGLFVNLWETESSDPKTMNNAFRAIAFEGSPILEALEIPMTASCSFLNKDQRLVKVIKMAMTSTAPSIKLKEIIEKSFKHEEEIEDDNGARVPIVRCSHCMATLQTELVNAIRSHRAGGEETWLRYINQKSNELLRASDDA